MNKKILTLAVAGALVGAVGVAQADVTVYGKAHMSIDTTHVDKLGGYDGDTQFAVANNSSRLGFKFSEDLGGGFVKKVIGQYEATVTLDGDTTATTTGLFGGPIRNSYLGLDTAGGTLLAGVHDTPMKLIGRAIELFPEQMGDARNITDPDAAGNGTWDLRLNNVVAYATPSMAGVQAIVAYSTDTVGNTAAAGAGDNNNNRAMSASVTYKGGPVYVGAAYEVHVDPAPTTNTADDESAWRVAASGTFGMFKVIGLYQQSSNEDFTSGKDRSVYGLGAAMTLAEKHVIKAQYYKADTLDNAAAGVENGADMYAVGYDYKFSKKTTGYVSYAKTMNDSTGAFSVNGGGKGDAIADGVAALNGAELGGLAVGLWVDF